LGETGVGALGGKKTFRGISRCPAKTEGRGRGGEGGGPVSKKKAATSEVRKKSVGGRFPRRGHVRWDGIRGM